MHELKVDGGEVESAIHIKDDASYGHFQVLVEELLDALFDHFRTGLESVCDLHVLTELARGVPFLLDPSFLFLISTSHFFLFVFSFIFFVVLIVSTSSSS